jgi:hypothetical protein
MSKRLEKIVITAGGELVALGDHPIVAREALEDVPGVDLTTPGMVRITGTVVGQTITAVYTIRGTSLDGSVWALTRRQ